MLGIANYGNRGTKMRASTVMILTLVFSALVPGEVLSSSANVDNSNISPDFTYSWRVNEFNAGEVSSLLLSEAFPKITPGRIPKTARCSEIGPGQSSIFRYSSGSCDPADYPGGRVWANYGNLHLPTCLDEPKDCISEVFAIDQTGGKINGEFIGYVQSPWPDVAANNLTKNPRGTSSGIWKINGVMNSLNSDYYIAYFRLNGGKALIDNGRVVTQFPAEQQTFNISIRPVADASLKTRSFTSWDEYCIICEDMPLSYRFGVSAVVHQTEMNWYAGRLADPLVQYEKVNEKYNRITVSGQPVKIPTFQPKVKRSEANPQLIELMQSCHRSPSLSNYCQGQHIQGSPRMQGGTKIDFLEAFRPSVGDKATSSRIVWTARSVYPRILSSGKRTSIKDRFVQCSSLDRPAGISTTNAMIFDGYIPEFKGGFLNYSVSGLHYEEDGLTKFRGRYDMALDENIARCIFGYPKTAVSATVSVVNADGERSIATTTVGVKNGQLRLSANNFTFSDKTIRLQINAKGYATCVRSDTVRYVKGTRCPGGFKKAG
jgi:hypothetical protein